MTIENLHRQPIYTHEDLGKAKAEVAASFIEKRVPGTRVNYFAESIGYENAGSFLHRADIVVDCLDNLDSRLALNRDCVRSGVTLVHTGALGWEGSLGVFRSPETACLECLFPPLHDDSIARCDQVGILGTTASLVGSFAAAEAIKLLVGIESSILGKIVVFDFLRTEQHLSGIARREGCGGCGSGGHEKIQRQLLSLCGNGEYYAPRVYASSAFGSVVVSLANSAEVKRMGPRYRCFEPGECSSEGFLSQGQRV